jgi:hypothetical protein
MITLSHPIVLGPLMKDPYLLSSSSRIKSFPTPLIPAPLKRGMRYKPLLYIEIEVRVAIPSQLPPKEEVQFLLTTDHPGI